VACSVDVPLLEDCPIKDVVTRLIPPTDGWMNFLDCSHGLPGRINLLSEVDNLFLHGYDILNRAIFEQWDIHGAGHAWSGGSLSGT